MSYTGHALLGRGKAPQLRGTSRACAAPRASHCTVIMPRYLFRGVSLTLQGRINSIANFPHSQLSRARPHNSIALSRADSEKLHSFVWSRGHVYYCLMAFSWPRESSGLPKAFLAWIFALLWMGSITIPSEVRHGFLNRELQKTAACSFSCGYQHDVFSSCNGTIHGSLQVVCGWNGTQGGTTVHH